MRSGELRHRVVIQQATTTHDEYNQPIQTWQDFVTVWAKVEDLSGREYFAAQERESAEVKTRVTIRYRTDVQPNMRVVSGSRTFEIVSVIEPDGRKRELQLMCREAVI